MTAEQLIEAYRNGIFPMADSATSRLVRWYAPDPRSVLPLDAFHVPHNVSKLVRQGKFEVTVDRDFASVIAGCAQRDETWISQEIVRVYSELHQQGLAHSVECWKGGLLTGGLYGVSIGGAFFGESMFSRVRDASKVALVHLVGRLIRGGYRLLDIQMTTSLTAQFGAIQISKSDYQQRLAEALKLEGDWLAEDRG